MKITWSKLSPEERDRAVCEAVGIPMTYKNWGLRTKLLLVHLSPTRSQSRELAQGYADWVKKHNPNDSEADGVPEEIFHYPAVSTDANEALRVLAALDGHATLNTPLRENDVRQWHCTINICQAEMPDFCHAICIASLRAKGIEVEL